jgi:hypothetical protein
MAMGPEERRLVELMQSLNFGRIEHLVVAGGRPVFDPPPEVVREIKFGTENGPRLERFRVDFTLKTEVLELLAQLEALGEGVVRSIEVRHGLPFRMIVVEADA